MRSHSLLGAAALVTAAAAVDPRFVMYFDEWHQTTLPDKSQTEGVNYCITAFANSSLFAAEPAGEYKPFKPLSEVRAMFQEGTKVCMAIGGWGDTTGFGEGIVSAEKRKTYAKNIADTLDRLGYDCVDIDWEYPGGNGADYKQIPNEKKKPEIAAFPELLKEIKAAIGDKELSIAVPGLERDMIAYTAEQVPKINEAVDFVNVMAYDLMNRRDTQTTHHASIAGVVKLIETYVTRGFKAEKLIVGVPFYAKFFTTKKGYDCTQPNGCPTELLEAADGSDTGKSGAMTFEKANYASAPTDLKTSSDNSCGVGTLNMCGEVQCCSQYGYCGNTTAHCDVGCQYGYGRCEGVDTKGSFKKAMEKGVTDESAGGQWYWDSETSLFWTWDTPELTEKKLNTVHGHGVGGIMAWSLAEDSYDWSHLKAMQSSFKSTYSAGSSSSGSYGSGKSDSGKSSSGKTPSASGNKPSGDSASDSSASGNSGKPSGNVSSNNAYGTTPSKDSGSDSSASGNKPSGNTGNKPSGGSGDSSASGNKPSGNTTPGGSSSGSGKIPTSYGTTPSKDSGSDSSASGNKPSGNTGKTPSGGSGDSSASGNKPSGNTTPGGSGENSGSGKTPTSYGTTPSGGSGDSSASGNKPSGNTGKTPSGGSGDSSAAGKTPNSYGKTPSGDSASDSSASGNSPSGDHASSHTGKPGCTKGSKFRRSHGRSRRL